MHSGRPRRKASSANKFIEDGHIFGRQTDAEFHTEILPQYYRGGGCCRYATSLLTNSCDGSNRSIAIVRSAQPQWYAIKYYLVEATMSAITATEARKSLFGLIQQVNDDHSAVEVVSRHGNAVILSKDDYDAMTETAYLLRNPANAERLLAAIGRARRGEVEQHDLFDA